MRAFRPASTASAPTHQGGRTGLDDGRSFPEARRSLSYADHDVAGLFSRTAGDGPRNATEYGHMSRVNVDIELAISSLALDLLFD